ncbi:hypothetical protein COV24_00365 [candidate division WWE3 bacterium CG10_big_fil_rev_8_21_14_0_10_32_10]|uniref:Uncharacterized protein n=1 Tax=candidate division WWE3 bacterium CG10_big_fil_rev_8_21_14_0_10_32_10 TaxID=1975090 RepID=A0A2H0RBH3_UNCKA|nr:MAG: hypothetical protein COV24_00365 [candidate division WWE3 bacterium CG10_big_fil_rev_8_21_14_0_10_32_10]
MNNNFLPLLITSFDLLILILILFYWGFLLLKEKKLNARKRKINEEYTEIVKKAHDKANRIIEKSEYISKALEESANQTFLEVLDGLKSSSTNFYSRIEQKYEQQNLDVINQVSHKNSKDLEEFSKIYRQNLSVMQEDMKKTINKELESSVEEVKKYKQEKLDNIDSMLHEKINALATKLLPDFISISDHEEMFKKAVEEAKKEGLFN